MNIRYCGAPSGGAPLLYHGVRKRDAAPGEGEKDVFPLLVLFGIAGLVTVDQVTKALAVTHLQDGPLVLWDGVFELSYVENRGAAFGLGQGWGWLFVVVTAVVVLSILGLLFFTRKFRHPLAIASGLLIAAGGIGNLIDRIWHGYVVDFLYFKLIDFPVFNVADCCVVVGAALLILYVLFGYHEPQKAAVTEGTDEAGQTAATEEERTDGAPDGESPAGSGGIQA